MSEDLEAEAMADEPKKRGRKPKAQELSTTEQKLSTGIHFGVDSEAAVVIVCSYNQRREYAERLFANHRDVNGLTLTVPACGTSITYQGADRIPLGWNQCGCSRHAFVKWMEV